MIIKSANVLCDDFVFRVKDVEVKDGLITSIEDFIEGEDQLDARGKLLLPGLIDIHTHGCVGKDTCDGDINGYEKMSHFYASQGVTSFLFTTMTLSEKQLTEILNKIHTYMESGKGGAYAHGVYLEGPFINPEKKGAQNGAYIVEPDYAMFKRLNQASGNLIKAAAIAPEMGKAMECISSMSGECSVTLAHTDADFETACAAFAAGAKSLTHTFNAMPGIQHRYPGPIAAALDHDAYMELICDGIHVHPSIIRMMFKMNGADQIVLISDSMEAAGMPDGVYSLGGQTVYLNGHKAALKDGTIAGSAASLHDCVIKCIESGIKRELAIKAASDNPSRLLGINEYTGSIKVGKSADLVLSKEDLTILKVWIRGKLQ